jgi:hypothetical protein
VNPITKFKIISNNLAEEGEKPVEEQFITMISTPEKDSFELP